MISQESVASTNTPEERPPIVPTEVTTTIATTTSTVTTTTAAATATTVTTTAAVAKVTPPQQEEHDEEEEEEESGSEKDRETHLEVTHEDTQKTAPSEESPAVEQVDILIYEHLCLPYMVTKVVAMGHNCYYF